MGFHGFLYGEHPWQAVVTHMGGGVPTVADHGYPLSELRSSAVRALIGRINMALTFVFTRNPRGALALLSARTSPATPPPRPPPCEEVSSATTAMTTLHIRTLATADKE